MPRFSVQYWLQDSGTTSRSCIVEANNNNVLESYFVWLVWATGSRKRVFILFNCMDWSEVALKFPTEFLGIWISSEHHGCSLSKCVRKLATSHQQSFFVPVQFILPPPNRILQMGPIPPCFWQLVVITGNLFKLVHLKTYPTSTDI